jgi:hypothetical protein
MAWTYDKRLKRYRETETGRLLSVDQQRKLHQKFIDTQKRITDDIATRLSAKSITLQQAQREFRERIKIVYVDEYALGIGGRNMMTPTDFGRLGAMIKTQYNYAQLMFQEIARGEHSERMLQHKFGNYLESGGQAYERGYALSYGYELPTYPRDGSQTCRCITTPDSRITTERGLVPISQIEIGDMVLTHLHRYRRVIATPVTLSEAHHKQAWVVSEHGGFLGCTSDHKWLTEAGWLSAAEIDLLSLQIYSTIHVPTLRSLTPTAYQSAAELQRVLPLGSKLYDLTVEDDHSFIIEGLISHNSNCRCYWSIEETTTQVKAVWVKASGDNCDTCTDNARNYNPYTVSKNRVIPLRVA